MVRKYAPNPKKTELFRSFNQKLTSYYNQWAFLHLAPEWIHHVNLMDDGFHRRSQVHGDLMVS